MVTSSTNRPEGILQSYGESLAEMIPPSVSERIQCVANQLRTQVQKEPETAALWCLGIGFIVGWKLRSH